MPQKSLVQYHFKINGPKCIILVNFMVNDPSCVTHPAKINCNESDERKTKQIQQISRCQKLQATSVPSDAECKKLQKRALCLC